MAGLVCYRSQKDCGIGSSLSQRALARAVLPTDPLVWTYRTAKGLG
jgi:hypothetical protein